MKPEIYELKKLNAAYIAALEFDYCPDSKKSKDVYGLFDTNITSKQLKEALDENQGRRSDEIMGSISEVIKNL